MPQWEMTLGAGQMIAEQLVKMAGKISQNELDTIYNELDSKIQTMTQE
jgi:hypothetical protein